MAKTARVNDRRQPVLHGRPRKPANYVRAAVLPRRYRPGTPLPDLRVVDRGLHIDVRHLAAFRALSGASACEHVPFDYPLWLLFHYHLGIFGHPQFPVSLTALLAMHTRVLQHRRLRPDHALDLEVRTLGQRQLAKGVEFDLRTVLSQAGAPAWEGISAYYLRGPGGGAEVRPIDARLAPLKTFEFETQWPAPRGVGWHVARLTGDYNPMHYASGYARRFGFARAFAHTQLVVGLCLRRLPEPLEALDAGPLRLDVAYKGPVYYGSRLTLKGARAGDGCRFDLYCDDADKPAVPGRLERVSAGEGLASD